MENSNGIKAAGIYSIFDDAQKGMISELHESDEWIQGTTYFPRYVILFSNGFNN